MAAAPLPGPWLPPSPGRGKTPFLHSLVRPVCPTRADAFVAARSALELQQFPGDRGLSKDRGSRVGLPGLEPWP